MNWPRFSTYWRFNSTWKEIMHIFSVCYTWWYSEHSRWTIFFEEIFVRCVAHRVLINSNLSTSSNWMFPSVFLHMNLWIHARRHQLTRSQICDESRLQSFNHVTDTRRIARSHHHCYQHLRFVFFNLFHAYQSRLLKLLCWTSYPNTSEICPTPKSSRRKHSCKNSPVLCKVW